LERTEAQHPRYEPGQGWSYSNIGYLIVRELIEETVGLDLSRAISRLVLLPLGISGVHIAQTRNELANVAMGTAGAYHPGWVYHGLAVGRLREAAFLLDRLMTGTMLLPDLLEAMCEAHPVGGRIPGRPWKCPGYGLGVMSGVTSSGHRAIGHTGAGPGSVIAVYYRPEARLRTVAAFAFGDDQGQVEETAFSTS